MKVLKSELELLQELARLRASTTNPILETIGIHMLTDVDMKGVPDDKNVGPGYVPVANGVDYNSTTYLKNNGLYDVLDDARNWREVPERLKLLISAYIQDWRLDTIYCGRVGDTVDITEEVWYSLRPDLAIARGEQIAKLEGEVKRLEREFSTLRYRLGHDMLPALGYLASQFERWPNVRYALVGLLHWCNLQMYEKVQMPMTTVDGVDVSHLVYGALNVSVADSLCRYPLAKKLTRDMPYDDHSIKKQLFLAGKGEGEIVKIFKEILHCKLELVLDNVTIPSVLQLVFVELFRNAIKRNTGDGDRLMAVTVAIEDGFLKIVVKNTFDNNYDNSGTCLGLDSLRNMCVKYNGTLKAEKVSDGLWESLITLPIDQA